MKELLYTIGLILAIALLVLGFFVFIVPRITGSPTVDPGREAGESAKEIIDVQDIVDDPVVFDGLTVEVEARVTDWVTKESFTIGGGRGLLGANSLLVIRQEPFRLPTADAPAELGLGEEDAVVAVRGRVTTFDVGRFEYNWGVDLHDEELSAFNGRPAIIAESVVEK